MTKKKSAESIKVAPVTATDNGSLEVSCIKGFDANLKCRDFQFQIGESYIHYGDVKACSGGFHACPDDRHPLSVFEYYPPATSRYADVKQSGKTDREGNKMASARIAIQAEIDLTGIIQRAVKWVFDRAKWVDGPIATGENEAATSSGEGGAATSSGDGGKVRGVAGCALFLVYRHPESYDIIHAWAGIVGQNGIKSMIWYTLSADGLPI